MRTMYLLRGVSGSGKSTLAKQLAQLTNGVSFENDTFHTQDGVYKYDIARQQAAQDWCYSCVAAHMADGNRDVVVANTNTKEEAFEKYVDLAKRLGYRVVSLVVENRHGNNSIHDVPESIRETQEKDIIASLKLK